MTQSAQTGRTDWLHRVAAAAVPDGKGGCVARRVLVVDDERQIRGILGAYLRAEGFEVQEAASGAQALHVLSSDPPDLVLLDIGLPDIDGLDVLRELRKTSDVYVVLVTARAEEIDTIVGLGVGADDYVTKPFSPREVVARVKAVLRRIRPEPTELVADEADGLLRFDGLSVDELRREVRVGRSGSEAGRGSGSGSAGDAAARVVTLTALEFDLLVALARSPGRVFSRSQLLEKVWGYDFFGDERVVDVHIRGMRKALGDDATSPRIIGTVRSVGYKLLLDPVSSPS